MSKIKVKCDNCEKIIEKELRDFERNEHNFCCNACYANWMKKGEIAQCETCGKSFYARFFQIKNGKGKYCCHSCASKRKNNPNWKGGKIKKICSVCDKEFEVPLNVIKRGGGKFCSNSCKRKAQKIPTHHTKPELEFEEICNKNNLPFKYTGDGSFWIGKNPSINPDFIECNGKKIAIEIFSYWHDSLRRNGKVRYSHTYEGRKRLLKKHGYRLIVFWQEDLEREDAEQFVLKKLKKEKIT